MPFNLGKQLVQNVQLLSIGNGKWGKMNCMVLVGTIICNTLYNFCILGRLLVGLKNDAMCNAGNV